MLDDLGSNREPEAGRFAAGLGRKKGFRRSSGGFRSDADAIVGNDESNSFAVGSYQKLDQPARLAGVAGIEKKVDEHLFQQARVARDVRKMGIDRELQADPRLLESVLD